MELEELLEEIAQANESIAEIEANRNALLAGLSEKICPKTSGDYVAGNFTIRFDSTYQTPVYRYKVLRNVGVPMKLQAADQTESNDKSEPC